MCAGMHSLLCSLLSISDACRRDTDIADDVPGNSLSLVRTAISCFIYSARSSGLYHIAHFSHANLYITRGNRKHNVLNRLFDSKPNRNFCGVSERLLSQSVNNRNQTRMIVVLLSAI